jgi:hypothetical protein
VVDEMYETLAEAVAMRHGSLILEPLLARADELLDNEKARRAARGRVRAPETAPRAG